MNGLPLPAGSKSTISTTAISYLSVSTLATFVNKLLYVHSEYKFPFPFITVFFQLVITLIFMALWSFINPTHHPSYFRIPKLRWNSSVAIRIAPLTLVYLCVIIFNPLFLQHVEVSTYHFTHSLSIAFSMIFSHLMLHVENSQRVKSACIIMIIGMCLGFIGHLNFSVVSTFYGLGWPAILAIYSIYLKKTLVAFKNDFWLLIQYNTIMSTVIMIPLIFLSGELDKVFTSIWFWDETGFWVQMIITSLTNFSVNVIMLILLIRVSPLSLSVAGVTKTIIQTLIAYVIFGNPLSLLNLAGMLLSLAGAVYYARLKTEELKL
ncbi:triose-phosphate transporter family-domain-containing protein [Mycotypha africana]|uniref:triose-phosphate transporter family-domain-containing protein n=1 Tax=Mycotypha africana TaxID=64632 RepID=UPI002300FCDD|nr:triose-phosphate transporter family-domain-containing protein [Mycotypha africana]KAI8988336.1 triose-phosphate transporter family-domain-containing protein [Mycotypha africana]